MNEVQIVKYSTPSSQQILLDPVLRILNCTTLWENLLSTL